MAPSTKMIQLEWNLGKDQHQKHEKLLFSWKDQQRAETTSECQVISVSGVCGRAPGQFLCSRATSTKAYPLRLNFMLEVHLLL
jgi:hypothetical protein